AVLARGGHRGRDLAQADHDAHAGVLQVQRVGVTLGAVADNRDGLAVEQMEVRVVVVEHESAQDKAPTRPALDRGLSPAWAAPRWEPSQAVAEATSVRAGMASVPSPEVCGERREASPKRISATSGSG